MALVSLPDSSLSFLKQGAIIQDFTVAGHNLVLSFSTPEPYLQAPYFGMTIGRVANRIGDGLIQELNGRSYQLTTNQAGQNHLHGGDIGWGHRTFSGPQRLMRGEKEVLVFTYTSPDGEEGYPGAVRLQVFYSASQDDDKKTVLEIQYEVELIGEDCDETVVNVTNHTYFNLSNNPTIADTEVNLATSDFLISDAGGIPSGEIATFEGVLANRTFKLGATGPSIDHCFVMDRDSAQVPLDTRTRALRRLVSASHAASGICLEVHSTEPSFQFYTGDYVDVPANEHGPARLARSGFCVEPGRFINAINMPEWRNQVLLPRGQIWGSKIVYKAWKE